jgi:hypothetical protein
MRDEGPGDAEDPWIASQRSVGQLRQLTIVAGRQVVADLANLLFDEVIVVEQPLAGRRDRTALPDRAGDRAIGAEQDRLVLLQPDGE